MRARPSDWTDGDAHGWVHGSRQVVNKVAVIWVVTSAGVGVGF